MTFWVITNMAKRYQLNLEKLKIKILLSSTTAILGGTSAGLLEHDSITISELLYGMMLPSGNDAA